LEAGCKRAQRHRGGGSSTAVLEPLQLREADTAFRSLHQLLLGPSGTVNSAWQPVISSLSSTSLAPGNTYTVSGSQLNSLSQGAAYGDDVQPATNFPIVRITNDGTGHVFYARSFGPSAPSIAPGGP
jgi:hypothetical protein